MSFPKRVTCYILHFFKCCFICWTLDLPYLPGNAVLPPIAEATSGPNAHPQINCKATISPSVASTHLVYSKKCLVLLSVRERQIYTSQAIFFRLYPDLAQNCAVHAVSYTICLRPLQVVTCMPSCFEDVAHPLSLPASLDFFFNFVRALSPVGSEFSDSNFSLLIWPRLSEAAALNFRVV